MSTTVHRDWFRLVLDADGLSDYRGIEAHHHRADAVGRGLSLISMMLVGFIVAASAIGVARSRPQVTAESDALRKRVSSEQRLTDAAVVRYNQARQALRLTQAAVRPDIGGALADQLDAQSLAAAYVAMRGSGVVLTLEDSKRPTFSGTTDLGRVIDRDVQHAVNGLWQAGAEAIAINDVRITGRTSIRNAGNAIFVDYKPIAQPVKIVAIGDPKQMAAQFRALSEWEELAQLRDRYRIRWSFSGSASIDVPAGVSALPTSAQPVGGS